MFFSSRRRHTRYWRDWSSDVCSSDLLYGVTEVEGRTPTFCFTVDGVTPRAVSEQLAERGIYTWDGNYYALSLMQALGLEEHGGAVRAGFLHYNTAAEAERLCDAVEEIADEGRRAARTPRRDEAAA